MKNWTKIFKQLSAKPVKLSKYTKHNSPRIRSCGYGLHRCERCGRFGAHIHKYKLDLCRCCFREIATEIGFKKYS